ncbi:hypothetical protein DD237_001115 [Peronospora effusa]|nr:hypothetical protein DD237_001115 [Peronospora effusa]
METGEQLILTAAECGRLIAQDKLKEAGQSPLVLHYEGRHYSAFVHQRTTLKTTDSGSTTRTGSQKLGASSTSDVAMTDVGEEQLKEEKGANYDVTDESMSVGPFDPWSVEVGDGHLDVLHERCQELAVPHQLKLDIHQIL